MAGDNRIKDKPSATLPLGALDFFAVDSTQDGVRKVAATALATARVLFKWNELDLTQFDAATCIGGLGDLVPGVTVVNSALAPGKKAISFKAVGLLDNANDVIMLMRIAAAHFTAPASRRYIMRCRIGAHLDPSGHRFCIGFAFLSGTSTNPYANLVGIHDAGAGGLWRHWRQDGTVVESGSATPASAPAFSASSDEQGCWLEMEVNGKEGSPPVWRVSARGAGAGDTAVADLEATQATARGTAWGIAALPAAWNALVLDRAGLMLAVNRNGTNVTDPYYEILDFQILKHPMDE